MKTREPVAAAMLAIAVASLLCCYLLFTIGVDLIIIHTHLVKQTKTSTNEDNILLFYSFLYRT